MGARHKLDKNYVAHGAHLHSKSTISNLRWIILINLLLIFPTLICGVDQPGPEWLKIGTAPFVRKFRLKDLISSGQGSIYFDSRSGNYSHFLELPKLSTIYVIGERNKLLRLHPETLRVISSFSLPMIPSSSLCLGNTAKSTCTEVPAFNLLLKTHDEQNIWYCYLYQATYMDSAIIPNVESARCEIPEPASLEPKSRLVQWENSVFSSLDLNHPGVSLMSEDGFLYSAGWFHGALRIHRVRLPNFDGLPNWDQFLTTSPGDDYITDSTVFIAGFETKDAIYFVIREATNPTCESKLLNLVHLKNTPTGGEKQYSLAVDSVTRLIRICKGDRGGHPYVNEGEFSTFAKANMECVLYSNMTKSDESKRSKQVHEFRYSHALAAKFDPKTGNLFVSFQSVFDSTTSAAICVYSLEQIEAAFQSDLLSSSTEPGKITDPKILPNTFKNICARFNSKTLSESELENGRQLPKSHLLRTEPIRPLNHRPIIIKPHPGQSQFVQSTAPVQVGWHQIEIEQLGSVHLLYLVNQNEIERFLIKLTKNGAEGYTSLELCPFDKFSTTTDQDDEESGEKELISELHISRKVLPHNIYILTNRHVVRLSSTIHGCEIHTRKSVCLQADNLYCAWNKQSKTCEVRWSHPKPADLAQRPSSEGLPTCPVDSSYQKKVGAAHQVRLWWAMLSQNKTLVQMDYNVDTNLERVRCEIVASNRPDVDGVSKPNYTCWCQPCKDCSNGDPFKLQVTNCSIQPSWSPWSPWSSCVPNCGQSLRIRTRLCESPGPIRFNYPDGTSKVVGCKQSYLNPDPNRQIIPEREVEVHPCIPQTDCSSDDNGDSIAPEQYFLFPLEGLRLDWTAWSECTADCGTGLKTRNLVCSTMDTVRDQMDLEQCDVVGPEAVQTKICQDLSCPTDIQETEWTQWLKPILENPLNMPDSRSNDVVEHKLRYLCSASLTTSTELRISRIQYVERKCMKWDRQCTIPSKINTMDVGSSLTQGSVDVKLKSTGQWSSWSPWTQCTQTCAPPESVNIPNLGRRKYQQIQNNPMFVSGGIQTRRRHCLTKQPCEGGIGKAIERRNCPPIPICKTGWSCWSSWSSCEVDRLAVVNAPNKEPSCQWYTSGGKRHRYRMCIMDQSDWVTKQTLACSGSDQETQDCVWYDGTKEHCFNATIPPLYVELPILLNKPEYKTVTWTVWSDWTSCSAKDPNIKPGRYRSDFDLFIKSRNRNCKVKSKRAVTGHTEQNGMTVCSGGWSQAQTCPDLVLALASGKFRFPSETGFGRYTLFQIILTGCLSALGGIIIGIFIIIMYIFCCRKRKSLRTTKHGYQSSNGILDQDLPLHIGPPPQPLLSLPIKTDPSSISYLEPGKRSTAGRSNLNTAVYDSVASQDLSTDADHSQQALLSPSTSTVPENYYSHQKDTYMIGSPQTGVVDYGPRDQEFWSLPRQTHLQPNQTDVGPKYEYNEQIGMDNRMANSFTHGYHPEPRPRTRIHPNTFDQSSNVDRGNVTYRGEHYKTTSTIPIERTFPHSPPHLDVNDLNDVTQTAMIEIPPQMPLLPERQHAASRYNTNSSGAGPYYQPVGFSTDSRYSRTSSPWIQENSSTGSDRDYIMFERPSNPHLREPQDRDTANPEKSKNSE